MMTVRYYTAGLWISILAIAWISIMFTDNRQYQYLGEQHIKDIPPVSSKAILLQEQVRLQNEFQNLIHRKQFPVKDGVYNRSTFCKQQRILMFHPRQWEQPMDGFTLELQMIGRYLQAAIATDRMLVLPVDFESAYTPPNCNWNMLLSSSSRNHTNDVTGSKDYDNLDSLSSWNCLYQPISYCSEREAISAPVKDFTVYSPQKASMGITGEAEIFDTKYYGPKRVLDQEADWLLNPFSHVDIIEYWERTMGRFWIRCQLAHYLWKPSPGLQHAMEKRMSNPISTSELYNQQYIGMHIRYTDNIGSFRSDFGRDARVTRNLGHYMDIAQEIRNETGIAAIYVSTDSIKVVKRLKKLENKYKKDTSKKWSFYFQENVPRSDSQEWVWFADSRASSAPAIATDVEMLRRADYLIGSFQSNVYRLATELNAAYHVGNYPLSMNRHLSVDIEWYESP